MVGSESDDLAPHISVFPEVLEKIECYGCGKKIVYLPARVCTLCLLVGHVTEQERAALED
jgi:hypothetical protein